MVSQSNIARSSNEKIHQKDEQSRDSSMATASSESIGEKISYLTSPLLALIGCAKSWRLEGANAVFETGWVGRGDQAVAYSVPDRTPARRMIYLRSG